MSKKRVMHVQIFFLFILYQSLSTLTQTLKKATILIRVIVVPGRHVHKHKKKKLRYLTINCSTLYYSLLRKYNKMRV